jgi:hypothetical protein
MIDPRSPLHCITIEGSKESRAAGEYVIDVAEYSRVAADTEAVAYYQLKHSTTRTQREFPLSEIKDTLKGFAGRFVSTSREQKIPAERRTFCFVTNRPVSRRLKRGIAAIREGGQAPTKLQKDLERATGLKGERLRAFCRALSFVDGEGDYLVQKQKLRSEVAEFIAGFVDSQEASDLVALVEDRALPKSEDGRVGGRIYREDVLKRLGVNSERDLFPAPREIEPLAHLIPREQHELLVRSILTTVKPVIIHAAGGVGKSVVARQIAASLPQGSLGLVYDCFGAGKYRNESEPRHRPADAFVQLANELATQGLCRTLIGNASMPRDALFRGFLERIKEACVSLREINPTAQLVLLIDAADNAEMAAADNGDDCFAAPLLRESLPTACRLVALCRTERVGLLKPASTVRRIELRPFSRAETAVHLRNHSPTASAHDANEFHRLTGGNPRVQANALAGRHRDLPELLSGLGPTRTTVDEQIADQLNAAVGAIQDQHTPLEAAQVESICRGLANLPPFIPLPVLAAAAQVDVAAIKSFVSDLGRPLWHSDDSVQFRDEPTETWFRTRFSADPATIAAYAATLEPLATSYPYVAKALPKLWLRAGDYDRLIALALSDGHLPTASAIDARDIRVYRLQFAFKAALKVNRRADAARLAFRAGEEMAGNQRQLDLLGANTDLVAQLQEAHRIQEYAYKKMLGGDWQGSENAYSASLLSAVTDFQGEARGYLRAAERWLRIHFEERDKERKKRPHAQDKLKPADIVELASSHFHLFGPVSAAQYLLSWRPSHLVFEVTMKLVGRLVDAGRYDEVNALVRAGARNPHLVIAVAAQLAAVAKYPPKECLRRTLDALSAPKAAIPKPERSVYYDEVTPAVLAFAEACSHHGYGKKKIIAVLDYYVPPTADATLASDHREPARRIYFRGNGLRLILNGSAIPEPGSLLPSATTEVKSLRRPNAEEERSLIQIIGALLPWYVARAKFIARKEGPATDLATTTKRSEAALSGRYERYDPIPAEIALVRFELLAYNPKTTPEELEEFARGLLSRPDNNFGLPDRVRATRVSQCQGHLAPLRERLETSCRGIIESASSDTPEERSDWFVKLARAVLPGSRADAAAYFERAVEAVAKFGDEMVDRWVGVVAVARRSADSGPRPPETLHRFVRCAELIGETVAREKHWDREDVFRVALHLDPAGAFAALSRWRERGVGWFNELLEAFALELAKRRTMSPAVVWTLSGFDGCNASLAFLRACLEGEKDLPRRQFIFEQAVHDFSLESGLGRFGADLAALAKEMGINPGEVATHTEGVAAKTAVVRSASRRAAVTRGPARSADARLTKMLRGIDLLQSDGLAKAVKNFDDAPFPKEPDRFWSAVIARVPAGREAEFLGIVVTVPGVDYYDMRKVFGWVRHHWLQKAAVKVAWPTFVRAVGKRFAVAFSQRFSLHYWLDETPMEPGEIEWMKDGMVEALAESPDLVSAGTFFGFASTIAPRLTPDEAHGVLEFALSRFELHIEAEFADGPWTDAFRPPAELRDAFTGLIWSALGAPESSTRWQGAHCVRRLGEAGCAAEIASLLGWMQKGEAGSFGIKRFHFYRLHAQLYLLIALARVAVDDAIGLKPHAAVFEQIALNGMPHILLQKFAADIALSIERLFPGTYAAEHVTRLRAVGVSPFPRRPVGREYDISSPWHERGEIKDLKLHFAWDFDRYWFDPLGDVFGLPEAQVMDVAREAAVEFVGLPADAEYPEDGRDKLWGSQDYYSRGTSHDHGTYPSVDDYRFYYSYHAMLIAGARLLAAMPVIEHEDRDYDQDLWSDWVERHALKRRDGKWLVDRRDPSPAMRRAWTTTSGREHWLWQVTAGDFFDVIAHANPLAHSLCVNGAWSECDQEWVESVTVTSAWVRPEMATSLVDGLRACKNAYETRMPPEHGNDKLKSAPFDLTGWIRVLGGSETRLDHFDPYAKRIIYPANEIGPTVAQPWQLTADAERRQWKLPNSVAPVAVCEIWSEEVPNPREQPFRKGERMCASVEFLRRVAASTGRQLMIAVEIERRRQLSYRSNLDDYGGYPPSSHKIFVLSENGILHDARKSYQLG